MILMWWTSRDGLLYVVIAHEIHLHVLKVYVNQNRRRVAKEKVSVMLRMSSKKMRRKKTKRSIPKVKTTYSSLLAVSWLVQHDEQQMPRLRKNRPAFGRKIFSCSSITHCVSHNVSLEYVWKLPSFPIFVRKDGRQVRGLWTWKL